MNTLAWIHLQLGRQDQIDQMEGGRRNTLKPVPLSQSRSHGADCVLGRAGSWGGEAERGEGRWLGRKSSLPFPVVAHVLRWPLIATLAPTYMQQSHDSCVSELSYLLVILTHWTLISLRAGAVSYLPFKLQHLAQCNEWKSKENFFDLVILPRGLSFCNKITWTNNIYH